MSEKPISFEIWKETVHASIRNDPLWNFQVYPKSLFIYDLVWEDCEYLLKDVRGKKIAEQIIRSVGSISANIEEGYGRGYGKDYGYHLRIARMVLERTKVVAQRGTRSSYEIAE